MAVKNPNMIPMLNVTITARQYIAQNRPNIVIFGLPSKKSFTLGFTQFIVLFFVFAPFDKSPHISLCSFPLSAPLSSPPSLPHPIGAS